MIPEKENKTVLICPLDWGLGHAARCVPVINAFLKKGLDVIIAADKGALAFLKQAFSGREVTFVVLPFKTIKYQKRGSFFLKFLLLSPSILYHIYKEHKELEKIITEYGVDYIISDNRYGLWCKKTPCVFITHQVFVRAPAMLRWLEPFMYMANKFFINKYDYLWVPDMPGHVNLSGALSHKRKLKKARFVGVLSRFSELDEQTGSNPLPKEFPDNFILAMLSGPEPQRSILENILFAELKENDEAVVFLRGKADSDKVSVYGNRIIFDHLPTENILYLIKNANLIISRSGYTTLMELSFFRKKAIFIPTPGQTEQEYLGKLMHSRKYCLSVSQKSICLKKQLSEVKEFSGLPDVGQSSKDLLHSSIDELLKCR